MKKLIILENGEDISCSWSCRINVKFVVCVHVHIHVYIFRQVSSVPVYIMHIWGKNVISSFWVLLFQLVGWDPVLPILLQMHYFILYYSWVKLHCLCMSPLKNPFAYWWTPRLILYLGHCEQCSNKHEYASVSVVCCLSVLFGAYSGVVQLDHIWKFKF